MMVVIVMAVVVAWWCRGNGENCGGGVNYSALDTKNHMYTQ